MHWTDRASIINIRKYGENSAVIRVFSSQHGVYCGVVRGASSKRNRGIYQPGNIVTATWEARLAEHLGSIQAELIDAVAAYVMDDNAKLSALASACALLERALPERHAYKHLYEVFEQFLSDLKESADWQKAYIHFEMEMLSETGFGLDLSQCAATGATQNLIYVSPKSGRSVSAEAGEPYRERLLPLPGFLLGKAQKKAPNPAEILAGMELTGYFLGRWLLEPHGRKLPAARARLMKILKETHGAET